MVLKSAASVENTYVPAAGTVHLYVISEPVPADEPHPVVGGVCSFAAEEGLPVTTARPMEEPMPVHEFLSGGGKGLPGAGRPVPTGDAGGDAEAVGTQLETRAARATLMMSAPLRHGEHAGFMGYPLGFRWPGRAGHGWPGSIGRLPGSVRLLPALPLRHRLAEQVLDLPVDASQLRSRPLLDLLPQIGRDAEEKRLALLLRHRTPPTYP